MNEKSQRKRRLEAEDEAPEALTGTEVEDDDDARLAGPAATAAFEEPPEPLTGTEVEVDELRLFDVPTT